MHQSVSDTHFNAKVLSLMQVASTETKIGFLKGDERDRLRSRRGDNHFWVIPFHKLCGVVCFLI